MTTETSTITHNGDTLSCGDIFTYGFSGGTQWVGRCDAVDASGSARYTLLGVLRFSAYGSYVDETARLGAQEVARGRFLADSMHTYSPEDFKRLSKSPQWMKSDGPALSGCEIQGSAASS